MAKQVGPHQVEREIGDACSHADCRGVLRRALINPQDTLHTFLECSLCHHQFNVKARLPLTMEDRLGVLPPVDIPDEALRSVAVSLQARDLAERVPNPADRLGEEWDGLPEYEQEEYLVKARELLLPLWGEISSWFEAITFMTKHGRAAMDALTEIAIPSLKYCEEKYGHDDQARVNLEAAIRKD